MKTVLSNRDYWITGVLLAAAGVMVARSLSIHLLGTARVAAVLGGQFLAVAGLLVICVGVSRRIQTAHTKEDGR